MKYIYSLVDQSENLLMWDFLYSTSISDPEALQITSLYGVEYCLDLCATNDSFADFCMSLTYSNRKCYFHDKILDELPNSDVLSDTTANTFMKFICEGEYAGKVVHILPACVRVCMCVCVCRVLDGCICVGICANGR